MKLVAKVFLRGMAAILPVALTAYLVFWVVATAELALRNLVLQFVPPERYWTGMGVLASLALVLLVGVLMYSFVVRRLYVVVTRLLERIPIVKSVYGMVVDVVRVFGSAEQRPFRRVVLVRLPEGLEQIGFLTRDDFADLPEIGADKVAVYLPMSYQLGGFTMIVPRSAVRELSMPVDVALRFCITAGVARHEPTASAPAAGKAGGMPAPVP